jgi:general secretion pathway protein G
MKRNTRGFTLVEILIVVIILGILAAIVIPQFTNASNDARNNSVSSTLQTIRSQIELFKIQHADTPPVLTGGTTGTACWAIMLGRSDLTSTSTTTPYTTGTLGPYVQQAPLNPINNNSAVGTTFSTTVGWVYTVSGTVYTFSAVNTTGTGLLTY